MFSHRGLIEMTQLTIRYALDTTGVNPDNLVSGERHTLSDLRNRIIAPVNGAFFTDGFTIKDTVTGRTLVRGTDYVFAELYQTLTIKYGKEICGLAIITNTEVNALVEISYQALGDVYSRSATTLKNLLEEVSSSEYSKSLTDIRNKPVTFIPSPHVHDLGDGTGFEYLIYALERIRNAIVWADMTAVDSLSARIDDFIKELTQTLYHRLDNEVIGKLLEFKRSFTKAMINLGNVQNLGVATEAQGRAIAAVDYVSPSVNEDKYITLKALGAFKEAMYNQVVMSGLTNLGKSYGVLVAPQRNALASLPNGSVVLFDSQENTVSANQSFDIDAYPDSSKTKARWSIFKVTNNPTDRGGVLMGFNMATGEMYSGLMTALANGYSISWKRYLTESDSQGFMDAFIDHLEFEGDPHKTKPHHIGLGDVENLPVATREDIVCRKPVRKYMTYDGLLLWMKAFMTGVSTLSEIDEDDTTPSALQRYQMIFAPCGPCGGGVTVPSATPAPTERPVDPRGKLLTSYCIEFARYGRYADGFGSSYEAVIEALSKDCGYVNDDNPERGTLLGYVCDGFNRNGKYADGNGGFYLTLLEANSVHCGFVAKYTPTYQIQRHTDGSVLGYGFAVGAATPIDPAATVTLRDSMDVALCLIYPDSAGDHTVMVSDVAGTLIGYAIDPTKV